MVKLSHDYHRINSLNKNSARKNDKKDRTKTHMLAIFILPLMGANFGDLPLPRIIVFPTINFKSVSFTSMTS